MSRSGYSEDCENLDLWRGAVDRAIQGRRGQAFLREMLDALDAMPVKRLIAEELEQDGEVCAIGTVGAKRGIDMKKLDPEEPGDIAKAFGIARAMVQEIEYVNDEEAWWRGGETPEQRYERVRRWVLDNLRGDAG